MRAVVVVSLLCTTACLSDPVFRQVDDGSTVTTTEPTISSESMVLVPETTLASLSPTSNGHGKENAPGQQKKHDDDDDDDDTPPKPKPPAPAPAPTPAPAPAPSGSTLVPSFWVDGTAVTASDYASCVTAGACAAASCPPITTAASCVTRAQASAFCGWKAKRLVRDQEWTALTTHTLAGLTGLSGGHAEWVDTDASGAAVVRGGSSSSAKSPLGLDSSIPTVGFRCARDR